MSKSASIAVDGPAGAGKSTIAQAVAGKTGLVYVDTGAMYRAMALYFLERGLAAGDAEGIEAACRDAQVSISYDESGTQQVWLNGKNVSGRIRAEEVGAMASVVSTYPPVRRKLVELQQELAERTPVIMDGRDIGSVVLPDAGLKIYLTASAEVRARRRYDELTAKGVDCDLAQIRLDMEERDRRDRERPIAPLHQAPDAVRVDSSDLTPEEVVSTILALYAGREDAQ